jgi:hypothetical protein
MNIYKLENRKVVYSDNGKSRVVLPPMGISFNETRNSWVAYIVDDMNKWRGVYFSVERHGFMDALDAAVNVRELSLTFLLNRRMLPRLRKAYEILEVNGLWRVRDPIEKKYRFFSTKTQAKAFNEQVTGQWVEKYTFDMDEMVQPYKVETPLVRMDYLPSISPSASRSVH